MDIAWHEFETILVSLQEKIETIQEVQRQKGQTFNIFSILKMERREVETHSAVIYDFINPNGSHSQGKIYLELFVDKVLGLEKFDLINVKVRREDPTDDGRRIDFTIENDKYFIAIEMKIDAGDQDKQLVDYMIHANNQNKEAKLYYLTLDGRDASGKSINGELEYTRLSFALEIVDWIEICAEKSSTFPFIRESLTQYANLLKKITGQTIKETTVQVTKIINNSQAAKAATIMAKNIGHIWALREAKFWEALLNILSNKVDNQDWEVKYYNFMYEHNMLIKLENAVNKIEKQRLYKDADIGIYIQNKHVENLRIYIYQLDSNGIAYQIGDGENPIENIDKIAQKSGITNTFNEHARWKKSNIDIIFYGKNVNESVLTYELFDEKKFMALIDNIANEGYDYLVRVDSVLQNRHL